MNYMPKRIKRRRVFRGKIKGLATRGNRVSFGEFGLQSLDAGWITGRQLEASRIAANRATQGAAKIWIRVFPDKPISSKPAETVQARRRSGKLTSHELPPCWPRAQDA